MKLYERDFLDGLTTEEKAEYDTLLSQECGGGTRKFGRINRYPKYPVAARHYYSLFPNNHLDIWEIKGDASFKQLNDDFSALITDPSCTERKILNFINFSHAFHIIGSLTRCSFRFDPYLPSDPFPKIGHHNGVYLFPEFPLGSDYKADYLLVGKGSGGFEFVFIELEAPNGRITNKGGNLGNAFSKGLSQIDDWARWLDSNFSSLESYFLSHAKVGDALPSEFHRYDSNRMHFVVIAGLRKDFNEKTYSLRLDRDRRNRTLLLHYENLLDYADELLLSTTF